MFIGNFPEVEGADFGLSLDELGIQFERVIVPRGRTGEHPRCCLIEVKTEAERDTAITLLNGAEFMGQTLRAQVGELRRRPRGGRAVVRERIEEGRRM